MRQLYVTHQSFLEVILLSSREIATMIWLLILFIFCMYHSNIRDSISDVLRALWKLLKTSVCVVAVLNFMLMVYISILLDIFSVDVLKNYFIWYVFALFPMIETLSRKYFRLKLTQLFSGTVKYSIIPVFIINKYTFNLWVELLLLPFLVFCFLIIAIAETDDKYKSVNKLFNIILSMVGFIILFFALKEFLANFSDARQQGFWFSMFFDVISILLHIPFLYVLRNYFMYEGIIFRTPLYKPKINKIIAMLIVFRRCMFSKKKLFVIYRGLMSIKRPTTFSELNEDIKLIIKDQGNFL